MDTPGVLDTLAECGFPVEVFFDGAPLVVADGRVHGAGCVEARDGGVTLTADNHRDLVAPVGRCGRCLASKVPHVMLLADATDTIAAPLTLLREVGATLTGVTSMVTQAPQYVSPLANALVDVRHPVGLVEMTDVLDAHFPQLRARVGAARSAAIAQVEGMRTRVGAAVLDELGVVGAPERLVHVAWVRVQLANSFTPRDPAMTSSAVHALSVACAGDVVWDGNTRVVIRVPDLRGLPWWSKATAFGYLTDLGPARPVPAAAWKLFGQLNVARDDLTDALAAAMSATA